MTLELVRPAATTVAGLFAEQVARRAEETALRHRDRTVTYRELDRWSASVAADLADAGVGAGDLVALATERSPAMIAAVLGVARAGAGYLALDAQAPAPWRRSVLARARPALLLTTGDDLSTVDVPRLRIDEPVGLVRAPEPAQPPADAVFQVAPTSGTTGEPKLVRVSYGSMLNRLAWMWREHPFGQDAVVAVQKSPALVASPWEMFGGLLTGVPSVVLAREEVVDPVLLAAAIAKEGITHLYLTPHLIAGLLDVAERGTMPTHRMLFVTSGADALPPALARRFHRAFPGTALLNLYGMTETSSNIAAFDTAALREEDRRVPVGRAVAGARISVRDAMHRQVPIGVTGEIWVSGPPLALGYLGDPERTAERFVHHPDGTVAFRTGDRGRWSRRSALEVVGRTDNQVKIRGYRVELEEVDAALAAAPGVTGSGANVLGEDDPVLVGFVTAERELDLVALRAHLHERLPEYLVPTRLHQLPELPRGANGKIDRRALAEPAEDAAPTAGYEPADEAERTVVACWTEILGSAPRDATQRFFESGGHSLLAVRLIGSLEEAFGRRVPLRAIFQDSSVAGIVRAVSTAS
jgi:amino acid adenylation domain-containing protein